ncbi:MAG: GatB/YqeY domain-containing protein [Candidatus Eisenbacteria bacterium]|uniref:GatB/YqeY domain-containing protein n=1 Tax=Eiseniibacteriota bacterium TaxID=2212470 RepID=A0A937XA41_UNCEI|nr:GatB/YqeY domain-containing protein [Candidatus Eisenbacteria bacterium]
MSVYGDIEEQMKAAMKARDEPRLAALRMARARLKQHVIDQRVEGEISDADARRVVAAYVKQLQKSIPEFEKGGESGRARVEALRAEIAILEPFLPRFLDETATRALVAGAIEALGRPPLQKAGMVIGRVVKEHPGEVDPALVKRMVQEALGG